MHKNIAFLALTALTILLDQLSKWFVTEQLIAPITNLPPMPFLEWLSQTGERLPYQQIPFAPFFNIVMVWNKGMSFGLFNHATDYGPILLTILSTIITIIFLIWLLRTKSILQMTACALVIGGAIGNIIDRARFGAVIDFLDFHAYGHHFPAFNIADSAVCTGITLIILHSLFFEDKKIPDQPQNQSGI